MAATVTTDYGINNMIERNVAGKSISPLLVTSAPPYSDGALQKSRAAARTDQWQRGVFPKSLFEPSVVKLAAEQQAHRVVSSRSFVVLLKYLFIRFFFSVNFHFHFNNNNYLIWTVARLKSFRLLILFRRGRRRDTPRRNRYIVFVSRPSNVITPLQG